MAYKERINSSANYGIGAIQNFWKACQKACHDYKHGTDVLFCLFFSLSSISNLKTRVANEDYKSSLVL